MTAVPETLDIAGRRLTLCVRRHPRARRITVRLRGGQDRVDLVLPPDLPVAAGLDFLGRQRDWLGRRLAGLPAPLPLAHGVDLPVLGRHHRIRHRPEARGGVWAEDAVLHVTGRPEHLPRRLTDWLRERARQELTTRSRAAAAELGRAPGRIRVRELRSRWGSCSSRGDLSYCWRLVMAPEWVVDYVVAHEVAHLVEMNHSPQFWAVVARLHDDARGARAWLRTHGAALHAVG